VIPRRLAVFAGVAVLLAAAACTSSQAGHPVAVPKPSTSPVPSTSSTSASPVPPHKKHKKPKKHKKHHHPTQTPTSVVVTPPPTPPPTVPPTVPPARNHPVVVIDPGHSVSVGGTDPSTGLDTADYENEPEMRDVWDIALLVRRKLVADGYRVYLTKPTDDTPTNLGVRAYLANRVHADIALSIHDQAGSNGGIPFDGGNSNVYYQSVGDYRENPQGKKIYFTDSRVAAVSKRYGEIFQHTRSAAQGRSVNLLGNTGYDLGGRGLQSGNIWIVQLLSHVPWIYNEAGGNSAGMSGLDASDKQIYANGLINGVEQCVPIRR
jgi:N-acetylmuramoyl-L-alanine amidase